MKPAPRPVLLAALVPVLLAGCAGEAGEGASSVEAGGQAATELVKVTDPHPATGGTLLEGPVFGPDGRLYVVDVMAPPHEPKVLRIDLEDVSVEPVYTDGSSAFTSAQFSPHDGRLYLTDIVNGAVRSITAAGTDPVTSFTGPVDGDQLLPDDIAFDQDGNLFVSDTSGMNAPMWEPSGRVVRIGVDGTVSVLAAGLPAPNGISFDTDFAGLWVSQYNGNRIDYLGLSDDGTNVVSAYPAIHVDGGHARVDSNAVDAAGNIYQAFHGKPEIAVFSSTGHHLTTIVVPTVDIALESATNIAIAPGTTDGYLTVSGPAGGYVYTFEALADGTRQSNGG